MALVTTPYRRLLTGGLLLLTGLFFLAGVNHLVAEPGSRPGLGSALATATALGVGGVLYAGFLAIDVVPLLRRERSYGNALERAGTYTFLWLCVVYQSWRFTTPLPAKLSLAELPPFVGTCLNRLPAWSAESLLASGPFRFFTTSFFAGSLLLTLLLGVSSFAFGNWLGISSRPRWLEHGVRLATGRQDAAKKWVVRHKEVVIHGFGWLIVLILLGDNPVISQSAGLFIGLSSLGVLFFYVNMAVLLPMLTTKRYTRRGVAVLVADVVLVVLGKHIANTYIAPTTPELSSAVEALPNFLLLLGGGAFFAAFAQRTQQIEREKTRELLRQQELENNLLKARLQTLTYQINPHFFFNSLNFIYSRSLLYSPELAEAVRLLSDMMRYVLRNLNQEMAVDLDDEVQHLRDFIRFNTLLDSSRQIVFEQTGPLTGLRIIPLLLVVFVENAVKHGDLQDAGQPLHIRLTVVRNQLTFWVCNKKWVQPETARPLTTRMGLPNARLRLDLAYPGRHTLLTENETLFYKTTLSITL